MDKLDNQSFYYELAILKVFLMPYAPKETSTVSETALSPIGIHLQMKISLLLSSLQKMEDLQTTQKTKGAVTKWGRTHIGHTSRSFSAGHIES